MINTRIRTRYVVTYEIKTKGTMAIQEENSVLIEASCKEFSLSAIKGEVLQLHDFDARTYYVRILGIFPIRDMEVNTLHTENQYFG